MVWTNAKSVKEMFINNTIMAKSVKDAKSVKEMFINKINAKSVKEMFINNTIMAFYRITRNCKQ